MSETTDPGQPVDPTRPGRATSPGVPPNAPREPTEATADETDSAGAAPLNRLAPGDAATRFGGSAPFSAIPMVGGAAAADGPALGDTPPGERPPAEHPGPAASPVQEWLAAKPDLATGLEPSVARDLAIGGGGGGSDDPTGQGLASDGPASAPEQASSSEPRPVEPVPPADPIDPAADVPPFAPAEPAIPATLVGTVDLSAIDRAEASTRRPTGLLSLGEAGPEPVPLSDGPTPVDPFAIPPAGRTAAATPATAEPATAEPPRSDHAARVPLGRPIPATIAMGRPVTDPPPADRPVPATIMSDRRPGDADHPVPATLVGTVAPEPPAAGQVPFATGSSAVPIPPAVEPELAVAADSIPMTIMGETGAPPVAPVAVGPVMTMPSEPTPIDLAAIPPEPAGAIPVAALPLAGAAGAAVAGTAAATAHESHHGQTAAAVFAHAHDDVEHRRGFLSHGFITKLAGVAGLAACTVGLAVMLVACAGLTPARSEALLVVNWHVKWTAVGVGALAVLLIAGAFVWRGLLSTAVATAVIAVATGGVWVAIGQYHARLDGFNALAVSPYIVYAGAGGLVLSILGGLIEHRRMREETHVLAAAFTNAAAAIGGGLLWVAYVGWKII